MLSFSSPVSYTIGTSSDSFIPNAVPVDVGTGDLNADGKLDMIAVHRADNSVNVLLGNGNGTFQSAVRYLAGDTLGGNLFVADFNNDGKLDVVVNTGWTTPNNSTPNGIVFLGNGNGTLGAPTATPGLGQFARGVTYGDFNNDGKLDLAATHFVNAGSGYATVLLGNGNGTFQSGIVSNGLYGVTRWVAAGDVNNDGKLDLLAAEGAGYEDDEANDTSRLTVMLGNGNGTFTVGNHYASPPVYTDQHLVVNPEDVFAGDVNQDGKLDAIVSNYDHNINVYLGNGDGSFQSAYGIVTGNYPRGVEIGDVNGDSHADLLITNVGVGPGGNQFILTGEDEPGSVAVILGNGNGTFAAPIQYGPSAFPEHATLGDFNGDGSPDIAVSQVRDGHAVNVLINQPANTNLPPTEAAEVNATPNPVSGTTANLSVLADDDGGESSLTYTWSAWTTTNGTDSAAAVTFAPNGTNAAKTTVATFPQIGGYSLRVAVADVSGLKLWEIVDVNVNQTLTSIVVAPASTSVSGNLTRQFTATGKDQFGASLSAQPTIAWSVSGGGSINSSGLFTAGATAGGPYTVTASNSGVNGTANVTVTAPLSAPPTVATAASATPSPVTATTTNLSVLGADDGGEANLTYAWTTTGTPPAAVVFSANANNTAKNTTATFTKAGAYNLQVTITDADGQSVTSSVAVTVNQTFTSTTVTPNATVPPNGTQQFAATACDQFGAALSAQPTFTWSVSGGGIINSTGLFTAGATTGGPFTVTATSGAISGTANLTVSNAPPATDTWTGLGSTNNWSDAANWSANIVPGLPTTVIFDGTSTKNAVIDTGFAGTVAALQINSGYSGTVSQNENLTVTGAFTEAAGVFSAGANTLFVAGNFTVNAGSFNAGAGTVTFNASSSVGTSVTVSANGVVFNNLAVAMGNPTSGGTSLTFGGSGTISVNGTFTYAGGSSTSITSGTINLSGDLDDQKWGGTGSPVFVFVGAGNQTIKNTNPAGSGPGNEGLSRNVTVNKPSGTLFLTTNLTVYGTLTLTAGTVNTGTCSWLLGSTNQNIVDTSGGDLGNIQIGGSRSVTSSTLRAENVTFISGSSPALTAPTGNLFVLGNWNNSAAGTFTANGGTVVFTGSGAQQLTSGGKAFNNLTIAVGATVQLQDNLTISNVFVNQGTLITNGHTVTYNPLLTSIIVSPATASVADGQTQSFSASGRDQLSVALASQPVFSWSISGLGSINSSSGLYTAPVSGIGSATVSATSSSIIGTATLSITGSSNQAPTVATAASATPSPVIASTTNLSVLGADDGGEANLTYTWATTGTPPATVNFSANGANAAKNTTATFTKAGTYTFQVTITDSGGLSVTSNVSVTVNQTLTTITTSPASASVAISGTQQFSAVAKDQFGTALTTQPGFTWSVGGGGSINSSGLFTAGSSGGGPFTVTATSSSVSGTSNVTITSSTGSGVLGAPVNYNIGTTNDGFVPNAAPVNVISADFNADGKLDLVVSHTSDSSIYILLGNDDGTFQTAVKTAVGETIQGNLRMGDFNNDGKSDLFMPSGDVNTCHPIIMLGNGDGTFQPRITSSSFFVSGTYARGWAVGDFNNDGKLDVVATLPQAQPNGGGYIVLLGNGDGTFQAGMVGPGLLGYVRWVTTGDFNGDGKLDLATADGNGQGTSTGDAELSILIGNGNGTFSNPVHYASPQTGTDDDTVNPEDVYVADVNADGKLDAIVCNYNHNINVFLGNGNGTFQAAIGIDTGEYPRSVNVVDINKDGKADLVVTGVGINVGGAQFATEGAEPGSVAILMGNGNGSFQSPVLYQPFAYPGWTAVGDFNGDTFPDFAVTRVFDGHSVSVMLNQPASSNLPPTVAVNASAATDPVTGATTTLSVVGADDGGESNLTYMWATLPTPPASVGFSTNGTNAAKNVTATFTKGGSYDIAVTITDANGVSAVSIVTVTVNATLTTITVSPGSATVFPNSTQQFTATGRDQFGTVLSSQPVFTWSVSGGGSVNSSGLFTAGAATGGPFTVTAANGSVSGTGSVTISSVTPPGTDIWTGLGSTNNWSDPANWSTNIVPSGPTTVIFDGTSSKNAVVDAGFTGTVAALQMNSGYSGTVSLNENLTLTGAFAEAAGVFSAGANTLFVAGNFTVSGGTFNAGSGTVTFNQSNTTATTVTVSANGVTFNNVTVAQKDPTSGVNAVSIGGSGTITVNGTFTYAGTTFTDIVSGTINLAGDLDNQKSGVTGAPVFVFNGTGNQTIKDSNPVGSGGAGNEGLARNITINKPSGTLFLTSNLTVFGSLTLTAGTVSTGTCAWALASSQNLTDTSGTDLGSIQLNGVRTVTSTSLRVANITFTAGASPAITAPTGNLTVTGNWNNAAAGTFTPNGGTVVFAGNGTQQLTSGGKLFNNLTIAAGATVQLLDNLTISSVFVNQGTLITNGHTVTYNPLLTSIIVSPSTAIVPNSQTQLFSASGRDQLGVALSSQPVFVWSASGLGSINSSGLYTAPATGVGTAAVTATSGGINGAAAVTVTTAGNQAPTVTTPAGTSQNPVTGTTTNLTVLGADDGGEGSLIYTWATTGTPPASVSFSTNGTNTAKNTTATFTKAGTYNFLVTITDTGALSVTSSVSVTVNTTLATITVSPTSATVIDAAAQQFSATGKDQFGNLLAVQPTVAWSVIGSGSVNGNGLYTAPGFGTGLPTVTATSGGVSGTGTVTLSVGTDLLRMAPAGYGDGISTPGGASLPSARTISNTLSAQTADTENDRYLSDLVYVWGQFLDHDIDLTPTNTGVSFNITVPTGDPEFDPFNTGTQVIPLTRSNYDPATGTSAANPRQQVNVITALIDGTVVYGSDSSRATELRTLTGGKLKTSTGNLLPFNTNFYPNANDAHIFAANQLFLAGDVRANENIELTAMQTLLVREHNRLADQIAVANPSWTDEQVYQQAKQLVVAEIQSITYNEFLPALLGGGAMPTYSGYNPAVNPNIATEFSTAAYRFGHSLLDGDVDRIDNNGNIIPEGSVTLAQAFFNPTLLDPSLPNHEGDIDPLLKGSASGNAQQLDTKLIDDVRNFLFGPPGAGGLDLASLNIQRGRDDGLADYNSVRAAYGLPRVTSFAQITSNTQVQQQLAAVYPDVDHVDLWTGGLAEDHVAGGSLGSTFRAIIIDQFTRLRSGDANWYEHTMSGAQLQSIQTTTLADLIRNNTSITNLQDNVFFFYDGTVDASSTNVTGTTVQLSVPTSAGADPNLVYTWALVGTPPAQVMFSANANNAAHATTATFTKPGAYDFQVTITENSGLNVTGDVSVVVASTLTSITVSPASSSVATGATKQFSASALDQFGVALASQPAFTWSASGGGSINTSGLFTAGSIGGSSYTITATSSGISGTASITINNQAPTVTTPAAANPSPVTGTTTSLSVLGADDAGEASLIYTWATTGTPPAPVAFNTNGANTAKNTTATFNKAGTYSFQVTITDAGGLTITGTVNATVNQTLTSITVSPASTSIATGGTKQFSATGFDQFGAALASQPALSWSTSGGGSINSSGLFTAGGTAGGPYTVTSVSSAVSGTAGVTITSSNQNLTCVNMTPTATGFIAQFNHPLNTSVLNLYDQAGALGPTDVTLVGATTGAVRGSLVINSTSDGFTFIRTAGVLVPDTYTVTFRSAANGLVDSTAHLLDGNNDGTAGDNYTGTFTVATPASNAVTVSLPDFARGPGQTVNVPAFSNLGIPINLSGAGGVDSVDFVLRYDPNLLTITGATLASGMPSGATATVNTSTPGVAIFGFSTPTSLSAGSLPIAYLQVSIPTTATYTTKDLLDITGLSVNEGALPAIDDDALHVVAYFGDATGNGTYSSLDTSRVSRLAVSLDSGLSAYQMADPVLVADITGNGAISSLDTSRISRVAVALPVTEVPSLPGSVTIVQGGPDPKLSIGTSVSGLPGASVSVPVNIDSVVDLSSNPLYAADLVIYFDPSVLTATSVNDGTVITGNSAAVWNGTSVNIDNTTGRILIGISNQLGLGGSFSGAVVNLNFTIHAGAAAGTSAINLAASNGSGQTSQLNEGGLTLTPAPTNAANDSIDGAVTILSSSPFHVSGNTITVSGTSGADVFVVQQVSAIATSLYLNGTIQVFSNASITQIAFDGLGGGDVVYPIFNLGTPDTINFTSGGVTVTNGAYTFSATNAGQVILYGDSSDSETFTGSSGDDVFYGYPNAAIIAMGSTSAISVGVTNTTVQGSAGQDAAVLVGSSGNDTLTGHPNLTTFVGPGYSHTLNGWTHVYAYGISGTDTAHLYDDTTNDEYHALSSFAVLLGPRPTGWATFLLEPIGFGVVRATASAGGVDLAVLYDTAGDETFSGNDTLSALSNSSFRVEAELFDYVYGLATSGGNDTATLDGSTGNDYLFASGPLAQYYSYGNGAIIQLYYFDTVTAKSNGGSDALHRTDPVDYALTLQGTWVSV